jgi:hypothetical protein
MFFYCFEEKEGKKLEQLRQPQRLIETNIDTFPKKQIYNHVHPIVCSLSITFSIV